MNTLPILLKDGYKVGHPFQYPENTLEVYSNITARQSRTSFDHIVFFGLNYFLKNYLIDKFNKEFFALPQEQAIAEYERVINAYLAPLKISTDHIRDLHSLGYLPLRIKALPEGSLVNLRVPFITVVNTHPDPDRFYWVTNMIETLMSTIIWGMITSATTAYRYRINFEKYAHLTISDQGSTDVFFQGHDFSMRGMFGLEAAEMSGAAHLTSFYGTDTIPAILFLERWYNASTEEDGIIGCSIPATEHSVMCMGSQTNEEETIRRLIQDVYPSGFVSIVSDTWDYWKVITKTAYDLKDIILARDGRVVFRPDSGDPFRIICGYADYEVTPIKDLFGNIYAYATKDGTQISEAEKKGSVQCLYDIFGGTYTEKGYITLNSKVGLIYGEGISVERQVQILQRLMSMGFASNCIVFGIGSFTYQYVTRDTYGMAMKATAGVMLVNGEPKDVQLFKNPKTDSGFKKSAKGLMRVDKDSLGEYFVVEGVSREDENLGELQVVFENSKLIKDYTLTEIRNNINENVSKFILRNTEIFAGL